MSEKIPTPTREEWTEQHPDFNGMSAKEYSDHVPGSSPEANVEKAHVMASGVDFIYNSIKSRKAEIDRWHEAVNKDENGNIEAGDYHKRAIDENERMNEISEGMIPEKIAEMSKIYDAVEGFVHDFRDNIEQKILPDPIDVLKLEELQDQYEYLRDLVPQVQSSIEASIAKTREALDDVDEELLGMKAEEEGFTSRGDYKDGFKRLHYFHPNHPQYSFEQWTSSLKANQGASYVEGARRDLKERLKRAGVVFEEAQPDQRSEAA